MSALPALGATTNSVVLDPAQPLKGTVVIEIPADTSGTRSSNVPRKDLLGYIARRRSFAYKHHQ